MFAVLFLCPIPSGWWSCGLVYNCVELRAFLMISSNWLGAFLGLVCGLSSQIISGVYSNLEVILVLRQCSLKHYSLILESHWKYTSCTLYNNQFKDLLPPLLGDLYSVESYSTTIDVMRHDAHYVLHLMSPIPLDCYLPSSSSSTISQLQLWTTAEAGSHT